jgi:putative pyruvate formate lyase activating enzyme
MMTSSRRRFLKHLAAAACAAGLSGCSRSQGPVLHPSAPSPKAMSYEPSYIQAERTGQLEKIEAELWDIYKKCRCCPRRCEVNRLEEETGICSSTDKLKVHSASLHFGEEKPLVGKGGSGTIFFSNCNLLCCFCQNWEINHRGDGKYISHETLAEMMLELQRRGSHIVKALRIAASKGLHLPLVYNTSAYDNLEVIKMLNGIVDIYLPDFKYQDGAMAGRYSSGAVDYPEVAASVISEMHRQVGDLQIDKTGIALRGLMIRHLVMPDNIAGTDRLVHWVARELSTMTYVNIMAQYHPEHKAYDYPEISRRITDMEYRQALQWARDSALTNLD